MSLQRPRPVGDSAVKPRPKLDTLGLLVDFGSTFTKVTAIDLFCAKIVGRAQARSTVEHDVCDGLIEALTALHRGTGVFERRPENIECLEGVFVRACSSAAGGLRIVVVGNVPGLTVEAGNVAALGAGSKLVGAFGFRLQPGSVAAIAEAKPDLILLVGGTDGGDTQTILHNARALAGANIAAPVIVAGNRAVAAEARDILAASGRQVTRVDNVMPESGQFSCEPARDEIRRVFAEHITRAKGLDRLKDRLSVVLPTPMAVYEAALLGAHGRPGQPGLGDLLIVDVGGATTDVHSIGEGRSQMPGMTVPTGLPEPFAKRTVEGDLGVRWNAPTILQRVGASVFLEQFHAIFADLAANGRDILRYVEAVGRRTETVPTQDWHFAIDALLARKAVDLAVDRHAGRRTPFFAREGTVFLQSGKDLTEIALVIGTGGVFTYNPMAERIIATCQSEAGEILRPRAPRIVLDTHYVLYSIGLLSDTHPDVAMQLFVDHFGAGTLPPLQFADSSDVACECCD